MPTHFQPSSWRRANPSRPDYPKSSYALCQVSLQEALRLADSDVGTGYVVYQDGQEHRRQGPECHVESSREK